MKKKLKFILLLLIGVTSVSQGQMVELFTTPGKGTWVCPPGVTSVTVECWGGGGAGGGGVFGGGVARGGGGAGGGYAKNTIPVVAGQSYDFMVGSGGTGAVPTVDNEMAQSGGNSYFINANTLNASGGTGGKGRITANATALFGAGGVYDGSSAVGTVKYNGGNGGTATSSMSGSGGSSAGAASDGTNGGAVNTPSEVIDGGFGAQGRNNAGPGNDGGLPGGGGGGARVNADTQRGGNGGNGQIKITHSSLSPLLPTIDWSTNNKPFAMHKRGSAAPGQNGFKDTEQTRQFLDIQASLGMTIHNGIRNLFLDAQTNEFYQENGVFKNQQRADYTSIRKYAVSKGLELISQVGGTPHNSGYEFDSTFYKVLPWGPHQDFAPLPKVGRSMQEYQRNFAEWAINADKAVGPNFHSIWIGTQEIAHTIGFPGGNANDTEDNKKLNIRRFTDYWKPINDNLRNAGARTGALQLNSSNTNLYNYAVDYMIQQKLHVDFLTYQFYQFGDTLDLINAVKALDRYNLVYPGTKIIVDRGSSGKIIPDNATGSQAAIFYLVGELCAINNADKIYAITLDAAENTMDVNQYNLYWQTRKWLNTIGSIRCSLMNLPSGVTGFVTRNDKKLSAVIWNRGNTSQSFDLKVKNMNVGAVSEFSIKHARGSSFISPSATWDATNNTITGISLNPFDYVLIDLEYNAVTGIESEISRTDATALKVYPNPASDRIYVDGFENVRSLSILSLDGRILHQTNQRSLDVRGLKQGVYILKAESKSGVLVFKKVVVK